MKIPFFQDFRFLRKQGFYQTQRDLHRFLHHISQLSGNDQISFAFHKFTFNKEDLTTRGGPGESCDYAGFFFLQTGFMAHMLMSQIFFQVFFCNGQSLFFFFYELNGGIPAEDINKFLQAADSRFSGVFIDHFPERTVSHFQSSFFNPHCFQRFRQKMPFGDVKFFQSCIAGERNNFHTV